ncbi:PAF15 factor, partial [Bucorvus abyssinicus]|nr:PAF15 factor [Bucorvus abyssinicus]
ARGSPRSRRSPLRTALPSAVLAARAPRKVLGSGGLNAGPSPAAKGGGSSRRGGGNPVRVRPVPAWQRGIGEFLQLAQKENWAPGGDEAGSSGL